MLMTKHSHHSV